MQLEKSRMAQGEVEEKTELRVLFEESLKKPQKFSLFGSLPGKNDEVHDDKDIPRESYEDEPVKRQKQVTGPSLTEMILIIQDEITKRWPEPVGSKFVKVSGDKQKEAKKLFEAT